MKTPYFLISEEKLNANVNAFKTALENLWPNSILAYSVKTNSLPWLLKYLNKQGIMTEVVSDEEFHLASKCGYEDEQIIFNGPIKGFDLLKKALSSGTYVNIDSQNDLECIKKVKPQNATIGIRVNVDLSFFEESDIGYLETGFRFGFSVGNGQFQRALEIIKKYAPNTKLGLHLHCNSITRSVSVYNSIAKFAAYLIKEYSLELDFIDIGGGFFGGCEGKPSAEEYITAIKDELFSIVDPQKTKLILEPGSAIIGSAVDYHTKVVDVKDTDYSRIITTDGSRVHIDPLWSKNRYLYSISQTVSTNMIKKQIVCGYTCMDHDRIMNLENEPELRVGDEIIYHRVGAYSMTFGGMFIRYYPEVYVERKLQRECVRKTGSVEMYMNIHSCEKEEIK